ncbi:MAG: MarR family transcriptional regulator [Ktedonobacteraceae bacterium]
MASSISVFLWIRLARIRRKYERAAAERLHSWDLSLAQFDLLTALGVSEGITQFDLAKQLLVTQGNITQLLVKLEQRGLLTRHQEGRTKCLMLTKQGRQLLDMVVPAHVMWNAEQFAGLSAVEQKQLLVLLRKLDHTLK